MSRFSFKRFMAVLRKEWIQVRRDPMTLRMIIALPLLQLFLFGYAINSNPTHLPTGLLSVNHSKYERTIVAALENTGYYDVRDADLRGEEGERALANGDRSYSCSTSCPISTGRWIAGSAPKFCWTPTRPIHRRSAMPPRRWPP